MSKPKGYEVVKEEFGYQCSHCLRSYKLANMTIAGFCCPYCKTIDQPRGTQIQTLSARRMYIVFYDSRTDFTAKANTLSTWFVYAGTVDAAKDAFFTVYDPARVNVRGIWEQNKAESFVEQLKDAVQEC